MPDLLSVQFMHGLFRLKNMYVTLAYRLKSARSTAAASHLQVIIQARAYTRLNACSSYTVTAEAFDCS